ncbi:protein kinase [Spongiactinospora sp. TRM90649]|uniref:protein kinase domain-containing protein n=1 Tax=Spongiactinospora sp. TRM90649 TaxID=3031114 RepID=UPI0023F68063|nr:protein kinase [Spongiactinospora sp. TRM90649]MDF5755349.1 protein kinase [Spongiactinospora sp. TRM90649]
MAQALGDGDPHRLGEYWLSARLGAGGQGVVYEAYAPDGRRVAIKVLRGDPDGRQGLRERLAGEAASAQRVASFCTARVLDADLTGARPYIVSEYVEGPNLRQAIVGGRAFSGDELHRLATAIATALTAIHEAGVIHRDLKPDNVLLGPDGPRVIDFGIARVMELSLTSTSLVAGTPTYMAPEIFTGQRAGTAADVFAWGGIMVFAATGADPFKGASLGAVMHRVLSTDPDLTALPVELRDLVEAALGKDPSGRPEARTLLDALISGEGRADIERLLAQGSSEARAVRTAPDDPALGAPALGTLAEHAYKTLDPGERVAVPEVFLRLVTVTADGGLGLRAAPLAELRDGRPEVARVLEVFSYLVTVSEEKATLTRPALVHAWPRLRAWVAAERDGFAAQKVIAAGARRWHERGRADAYLPIGRDLEEAMRWAATLRRNVTLGPAERDYLDAASALSRRRVRRGRLLVAAMSVLLVLALAAGAIVLTKSVMVGAQRIEAEARRLAGVASDLRATDPARAMLLSVAAWRLAQVPETREALTASLVQPETAAFRDPAASAARALSADGRILVSVSGGEVYIWDVRTGRRTGRFELRGSPGEQARAAALSPNGRDLAVVVGDEIRVWDIGTGERRSPAFRLKPGGAAPAVYYDAADDLLVVPGKREVTVWNTRSGRSTPVVGCCGPSVPPGGDAVLTPGPDGGIGRVSLPGRERRELLPGCRDCGRVLASREDGQVFAAGFGDRVGLYDAKSGEPRGAGDLPGWNGGRLRFNGDGALLASVTTRNVQVYRLRDRTMVLDHDIVPSGVASRTGPAPRAAFDPDGTALRYLDGDTVMTLDLGPVTPGPQRYGALSPDGRFAAGRDDDAGEIRLSDPSRPGDRGRLVVKVRRKDGDDPFRAAFGADGRLLAVTGHGEEGEAVVWDIAKGGVVTSLDEPGLRHLESLAFSPDGRSLATLGPRAGAGEPASRVTLWDLWTGTVRWRGDVGVAGKVAFTPDGGSVVTIGDDATGYLSAATGRPAAAPAIGAGTPPAFAADGTAFAAADPLIVWRPGTPEPVRLPLRGGGRGVTDLAFSASGLLATADAAGDVTLWDGGTGQVLGRPITARATGQATGIRTLALSPDGGRLSVLDADGGLRVLRVDPDWLVSAACRRAGRTLSEGEWRSVAPGLPYQEACPA